MNLIKFPRTPHIEGSCSQRGDEDLVVVPFKKLQKLPLVIEEKLDGANCGISFDTKGQLLLQSRGHYLIGGEQEKQFDLFKRWAARYQQDLYSILGNHYIMYGEWLYAKHTIFYDALPHYFLEFDIYDRETQSFLSTPRRHELLKGSPVLSVPVIATGVVRSLAKYIGPSNYKTNNWFQSLKQQSASLKYSLEHATNETDATINMEGLYIKWEENGEVKGRYKFVRPNFLTQVLDTQTHWKNRQIIPNLLASGVDLFLSI